MTRIWLGVSVLTLSAAVAAQVTQEQPSLDAVAKAAKEQRAAKAAADAKVVSKTPAKSGSAKAASTESAEDAERKKYTNEDLDGRPRPWTPTAYRTATRDTSMVRASGGVKDEAYWRRRAEPIRRQLQYSTDRLSVAKKRLENLKGDEGGLDVALANGRSSPVQAERQRLAAYVQELEFQVRSHEQAMKNLEDEGRKAGALPGWFR